MEFQTKQRIPVRLRVEDEKGFEKNHLFTKSLLRLGSGPECDLRLEDSGLAECHVVILREGEGYTFANTSDGQPTFLNGRQYVKGELKHGDVLSFGSSSPYRISFMTNGERVGDSKVDNFRVLLAASRAINSSLVLTEVLEQVMDSVMQVTGAEKGFLMLYEENGSLRVKVARNIDAAVLNEEMLPASRTIIDQAIESRHLVSFMAGRTPGKESPGSESIVRLNLKTVMCSPILSRNEVIGIIYVDHRKFLPDVTGTEQEILEALCDHASVAIENARLSERKLMTERLSAVGRMVSCMVHDFRGPLTGIKAAAQYIHECADGPKSGRMASMILDETERMTGMSQEVLEFCKGKITLNMQSCNLDPFLEGVVELMRDELEAASVDLELSCQGNVELNLDQQRIERVLRNLISNAVEAMSNGGKLKIQSRTSADMVEMSIEDNGCGMTEMVRSKAFEPFFTSGKEKGTGLGMAIAHQIIQAHGGEVSIESAPGRGTCIIIRLPFDAAGQKAKTPVLSEAAAIA